MAKVQTSWPEGFTVEGLPAWISYSIKPSEPGKAALTDEKIVTFTVTEQVDTDRSWPEKPEDAQNALKAAYVSGSLSGRMSPCRDDSCPRRSVRQRYKDVSSNFPYYSQEEFLRWLLAWQPSAH